MLMTINRLMYILVVFILIVFFILYLDKLSLILLIFSILIVVSSLIMCIVARKSISFKFKTLSKNIQKDVPITLEVTVKNSSYIPIANVVMIFEYFNSLDAKPHKMTITIPSAPKQSNTICFDITSKYCGVVNIKLFQTKVYDNLKLFCLRKRHQQECSVLVMPKLYDIPIVVENVSTEVLESDVFSKTKSGDDCSEIFDIRQYHDGDKLNRVHWKLSSKNEEVYVKEYSLPISNAIVILPEIVSLQGTNSISNMDTITEIVLSVSQQLNYHEVPHKIAIYTNDEMSIENVSNNEETYTIVGKLVRNGIPNLSETYAFKYFQAMSDYQQYSHIIYVTNVLNIDTLSLLEDFNSTKKTVLYVSNNPVDKKFLTYDGIQVLQVVEGKICECIGEFII